MANPYLEIAETGRELLAQTGDKTIFTVTGRVVVHSIVGIVTVEVGAGANNSLIKINPTVGADVDLCAVLDIDGSIVGTLFNITGTFANALQTTGSAAIIAQAARTVVAAGVIELECAASKAGNVKWVCRWEPLDAGSTLTPL